MFKTFVIFCAVFIASSLPAFPSHAKSAEDAKSYINKVAAEALSIIETTNNKEAKQKKLEKLFSDNVDIGWVAKFVMGRYWKQATDDQKKRYLKEYESFLLHHYASRFTEYTGGSFAVSGVREDGENEFTVSMSLQDNKNKGSEAVYVDYRVRATNGRFGIFDVIVEGVSMITTQRSEFASVLSQHNTEYLISQLRNKSIPAPN